MIDRPHPLKKRECLLVGGDAETLTVFSTALQEIGVAGYICGRSEFAELLQADRFSIIVLDGAAEDSAHLLAAIRDYCSRTAAVSLLLLPGDGMRGVGRGATLVARRPLTLENARQSLRSAVNLTRPPRRRTLRICVEPLVHLATAEGTQRGQVVDVSETGIAARVPEMLPLGTSVQLRLLLPGMKNPVAAQGLVTRVTAELLGVRFLEFASRQQQAALQDWIGFLRDYSRHAAASEPAAAPPRKEPVKHRSAHRPGQRSTWNKMWSSIVK